MHATVRPPTSNVLRRCQALAKSRYAMRSDCVRADYEKLSAGRAECGQHLDEVALHPIVPL